MSTQIADIDGLIVTSFYGGDKRGLCVQLTPKLVIGYTQLTKTQVRELVKTLQDWLGESDLPWRKH